MNEQRAIDKANRRLREASWEIAESRHVRPRAARRSQQHARAASHRAGRQIARAEERLARGEATAPTTTFDPACTCPGCNPVPEVEDVATLPAGCTYTGSVNRS